MIDVCRKRLGLTLAELVVVVFILLAVAGLIVPKLGSATDSAKRQTTFVTMQRLRDIIVGAPSQPGYWNDILASSTDPTPAPLFLSQLFNNPYATSLSLYSFNPITRHGWRGPYVVNASGTYYINGSFTAAYGNAGDPAMLDGWGNPIVIQWPTSDTTGAYVRLVSAGPNGVIDSPLTISDLSATSPAWTYAGDDFVLYLRQPLSFVPPSP